MICLNIIHSLNQPPSLLPPIHSRDKTSLKHQLDWNSLLKYCCLFDYLFVQDAFTADAATVWKFLKRKYNVQTLHWAWLLTYKFNSTILLPEKDESNPEILLQPPAHGSQMHGSGWGVQIPCRISYGGECQADHFHWRRVWNIFWFVMKLNYCFRIWFIAWRKPLYLCLLDKYN